jgi:hypothetical protein
MPYLIGNVCIPAPSIMPLNLKIFFKFKANPLEVKFINNKAIGKNSLPK